MRMRERAKERKGERKKERKREGRSGRGEIGNGSEGERSRAFTVITRRRGCIRAHCIGNDFAPN